MYGSISGVKDNIPRLAGNIKADADATGKLDIKESTVTRYLTEYSAAVDAALASRYVLPLADKSKDLANKIVNDLAAYKLARRYWINISSDENKELQAMRRDAEDTLAGLRDGSLSLPDQEQVNSRDDLEQLLSEQEDTEQYFDMGDPADWQDKLT